jgi:putative membrane protein
LPNQSKILRRADRHFSAFVVFFLVFYTVGIIGVSVPATKPLFIRLTPLALLLSSAAVALFHRDHLIKVWMIFLIIYFIGLGTEIVGVKTGFIFGSYTYGNGLGMKLLETPLIIGLNWLLLVYTANSLSSRLQVVPGIQILLAVSLMLAYDLILEQVAPRLDMWSWQNDQVPVQNYVAWFVLALLLSIILKTSKINLTNRMAPVILCCQALFFLILMITLK